MLQRRDSAEPYLTIPLFDGAGAVCARARISAEDAVRVGMHRWHRHIMGYAATKGGRLLMHRLVMGLESGDGRQVDHINGDKLDNRRSNLRLTTQGENAQNQAAQTGGASCYRGVARTGRRWRAYVTVKGRQHHLGSFDYEGQAALAAALGRAEHLPFSRPVLCAVPEGVPHLVFLLEEAIAAQARGAADEAHTHVLHAIYIAACKEEDVPEEMLRGLLGRLGWFDVVPGAGE